MHLRGWEENEAKLLAGAPPLKNSQTRGPDELVLHTLGRWASGLRLQDVPVPVRQQAIRQVLSTLAAVYSGWDSDLGPSLLLAYPSPGAGSATVVPCGESSSPIHAAMLMASWSMVLDYDDVMLGGHTGHSSVLVPLALASVGNKSGSDILLAQIVANEIAARINMVCALGKTRGQMATHLHLIAAAAAKAKLEGLGAEEFSAALALAISYPAQSLYPAFLGSDAKALCAALGIRAGMEAVDAVRAGLKAAANPLDGPCGFFLGASRVPVREFLGGLGERWHTETNNYKFYPASGYLSAAIEATLELVNRNEIRPDEIASVTVESSLFTVGMDRHSAPYLRGPASCISTLTFSTPFTIASAILAREFGPNHLKRSWIQRPDLWELASRITCSHDFDLTLAAMTADIPIGAALRRVKRWQAAAFGLHAMAMAYGKIRRWSRLSTYRLMMALAKAAGDQGPMSFKNSIKPMGARVTIRMKDGRVMQKKVAIPKGFRGAAMDDLSLRGLLRDKFLSSAEIVIGRTKALQTMVLIEELEALMPSDVAQLIQAACIGKSAHNQA